MAMIHNTRLSHCSVRRISPLSINKRHFVWILLHYCITSDPKSIISPLPTSWGWSSSCQCNHFVFEDSLCNIHFSKPSHSPTADIQLIVTLFRFCSTFLIYNLTTNCSLKASGMLKLSQNKLFHVCDAQYTNIYTHKITRSII